MSTKKISEFQEQLKKIKQYLPQYLKEHGYDVERGHKIRCLNPDHNDSNPSMSAFNTDDGVPLIRCHGCETILDIFGAAHLIEEKPIMGPAFVSDTVTYLADKYGVEISYKSLSEDEIYELNMYQAYAAASKYISSRNDFNELQIAELEKRRFSRDFCAKYKIGVCNDLEDMKSHLVSIGFMVSFLEEIDLLNRNIFNQHSLIYTISDDYGRPVAFMARNLSYDGVVNEETGRFINGPKFVGSKTGLKKNIYRKNERLYLLDVAKKEKKSIYIVEGNSDALSLHNNGILNAVGVCGLGFSDGHLNTLRRNSCYDIIICLDGDEPGKEKARRILDDVLNRIHDIKVRFVFLPDEFDSDGNKIKIDPDEYIRKYGPEAFLSLEKIEPFRWRLEEFGNDPDADGEMIAIKMVPIIVSEPSSIRRERMISELSMFTGFSEKSIRDEVSGLQNSVKDRIAASKKAVLDRLTEDVARGEVDSLILLNNAIDDIHEINKSANANVLDTTTRINNVIAIKEYEEDEKNSSSLNLGDDMRAFSASIDGDIAGKVIYIGGASNVGKTAQIINLLWRIALYNDDVCLPFLSIDDSLKDIIPRLACFDAAYSAYVRDAKDVFSLLNINRFAKPMLYQDGIPHEVVMECRDSFFDRFLEFGRQDKVVLFDSIDGRSIGFVETILKNYREKFPDRKLIFFLDNFHLLQIEGAIDGREKYKLLSHELKALAVKYAATIISSVEYTKMPPEAEPNNNNIAESVSLVYDSNLIWHGFNELHGLREKALAFFEEGGQRYPIVKFMAGKNKISSFKGNAYFKFYPEKSLYVEISEETYHHIRAENQIAKDQEALYQGGQND